MQQAFSTDVAYYEGRAAGIASVAGSTVEEARDELAARHGFSRWVAATKRLLELGADPNARGSFGGPDHGEGVTALHLAAQAGRLETVEALLAAGADKTVADRLHGGTPSGWASFDGHTELAEVLRPPV